MKSKEAAMPYSLYVHIPYCTGRCRYCDFHTAATGSGVPEAYINALLRDFAALAPQQERPATVYFGGGTPGLLSPVQFKRLLAAFRPLPGAEVTLETNPGLNTPETLAAFRAAGANRLSVGVQTAREASLRRLGRRHSAQDALGTLQGARKAGFENLSADIMLALPGYTNEEFDETLALIEAGGATHISAYLLKCEPGTPFGDSPPENLPDGDAAADFYLYAVERLENAGYAQYEISNFAKPGFEGRHNLVYWRCGSYLGLGPGAHSCMEGVRFSLGRDTAAFLAAQQENHPEGTLDAEDAILLGLRLSAGIADALLSQKQHNTLEGLAEQGLARKTGKGWALTPQGMLVQNSILGLLLG